MHARRGEWCVFGFFCLGLVKVFAKRHIDIAFEHELDGRFVRGGRIHGTFNPQVSVYPHRVVMVTKFKAKER